MYDVVFNHFLAAGQPQIFATVCGHRVYVFECLQNGRMELVQCYEDPDVSLQITKQEK